ncbi:lipocalin family protein [Glaciecola sp. 1036]|uniref:lipocalin family protein n=1 Tax=Alteromonadaceae TaxID=72275 RepID=UPI003D00907A
MREFIKKLFTLILLGCGLTACTSVEVPDGISPVSDFDQQRYLGTWYEIARLDHSFEKGLSKVTAQYKVREDGGISVINRGFDADSGEWDEAEGKAYFVQDPTTAHLKVSFFGPFYASYVVFALDKQDYQWALVSGPNREYFWILSRTPTINQQQLNKLIELAELKGFSVDKLIFVNH